MKCTETSTTKDRYGYESYYACQHKVYCMATFNLSTTGEKVTRPFCKKHHNALIKNCERIKRLTGYDSELTIEIIKTK